MKVGLVYPPSDCRHNESFALPNISLAVLADPLRRAGHEVRFFDLDVGFHTALREGSESLALLRDQRKVLSYLRGGLPARVRRAFDGLKRRILASSPIERCDLYGITLADISRGLFLLNAAALIAQALKSRFGAPIVLGCDNLPPQAYRHILERYPVFDYAVWASRGELPLLRLAERLSGSRAALLQTLVKAGDRIHAHDAPVPPAPCCGPDYSDYPLDPYRVRPATLLGRYGLDARLAKPLLRGRGKSLLIVPYRFGSTCRGRCAFCDNDASVSSDSKSVDEVVEDLLRLKRLGVTGIYFTNPNFNDTYAFAEGLCRRMTRARLGLQWSDCANFRELDEDLLRRMREAGAVKLVFGLETASDRLLRYIRKGITRTRVERYLRLSHELGIWNHIELIGGLPTETDDDIRQTADFIRANAPHIDTYALNPLYLYRGAPFFREAAGFGIVPLPASAGLQDHLRTENLLLGNLVERFDEAGGLPWRLKAEQIKRSTRVLAETIADVSSFGAIDQDHIHLLMFLYARLGHSRKGIIRGIFKRCTRSFRPYHASGSYTCTDFRRKLNRSDSVATDAARVTWRV
jgi:pyruvate-formate lyase-activating enzyme